MLFPPPPPKVSSFFESANMIVLICSVTFMIGKVLVTETEILSVPWDVNDRFKLLFMAHDPQVDDPLPI